MLKQFFEPILSKLGELTAACAHTNLNSAKDLKHTLETLRKKLKALSAKAFDVDNAIKYAEVCGQKKRKREVEEWLIDVKSIETEVFEWLNAVESSGFIGRFIGGGKATRLIEEVEKLVDQSGNFGELVADVGGARGETLPTTRMVGGAFEENLAKICSLLESGAVSRIGVYGMGGAGKSTLAMHVNNRLREQAQGGVFWVTVSQDFTITSLQDKIACSLGVKNLLDGENEVIVRAAKLHRALSQMKNSVLILDDVWENIDLLKLGCPGSQECCRLIITTRSIQVCDQIGCQERIAVQKLGEDEAWKLFSETLGEEIKLDHEVEEIAKSVAKLCDGLPLGLVTLGGSMRGETSIHMWRNVVAVLKEPMAGQDGIGEDEVFKVLKHSFDRLNKHDESERSEFNLFQLCFLYCSLYPEDHKIPREELVGKLISEGLIERRKSRREQVEQGHIIVHKLVKVCLLESCIVGKCVKMHDLVRGMALKIGGRKYMVRAGDMSLKEIPMEQEWTKDLEKVSLMCNDIRRIGEGTSPNCPNISTLLLQYNHQLQHIPDSFFCKMRGICTLDLSRTRIKMLPNSISELKSLKSLLLMWCKSLEHVPNLGKLKALRELNLDFTAVKEVPQGLEELVNLKLLSLYAPQWRVLPRGLLSKLVRLQIMRFPFHVQVAIEEFKRLKQLEEFSGGVKIVRDFNSLITSRVHECTIYTMQVGSVDEKIFFWGYRDDKEVILTKLSLKDEEVLGQDINSLTMNQCEGLSKWLLDDFSRLNNPTSLRRLAIERCGGIEWLLSCEAKLALSHFSTLETIFLRNLEDLKGLVDRGEAPAAPPQALFSSSLSRLSIYKCDKMKRLGLSLSEFPNLESLYISECYEIQEIFIDELGRGRKKEEIGGASAAPPQALLPSSLRSLHINWCNKMRKLGLSALGFPNLESVRIAGCSEIQEIFEDEEKDSRVTLPKLKHLSLRGLPRLKSVCKAPIICNSIRTIVIEKCPGLMKKMPLHLDHPPPPSLRRIEVSREWWESLEWDNPNLPTLLQPFLTFTMTHV